MTSAASCGHTHTHVLTAEFFSQTRRLSWIPCTLSHSSHWTWPLILPWPPHHLFFYLNLIYAVPDELRTLCSGIKRVPTLQNAFYLVQASIWKSYPGKAVFVKFSSCPLIHVHAHSTPHNLIHSQETLHTQQHSSRAPSMQKMTTTHTPTKQHKLTKHQSSHNSLSFTVAFQCSNHHLQLAILGKTASFCLSSFFCL
jgi:hypothetical protein